MRKLILILCAVLVSAALALTLLATTEAGASWVFSILQKREILQYRNLQGSFVGGLRVEYLKIRAPQQRILIANLALDAQLLALLGGEINVTSFTAGQISVEMIATAEDTPQASISMPAFLQQPDQPFLPVRVVLQQFDVQKLVVSIPDNDYVFQNVRLTGKADERGIDAFSLSFIFREKPMQLSGRLGTAPQLQADVRANWSVDVIHNGEIKAQTRLEGDIQRLVITQRTEGSVVSTLNATVHDWLQQPRFSLSGDLERLVLSTTPQAEFSRLNFEISGNPRAMRVLANGAAQLYDQPAMDFDLRSDLTPDAMAIEQLELVTDAGNLNFAGDLSWRENNLAWQGRVSANGFAANSVHPQLPEQLSGDVAVQGRLKPQLALKFSTEALRGQLRGTDFESAFDGEWRNDALSLPQASLTVGENQLRLSGSMGKNQVDVRFNLQAPMLADLMPDLSGALEATGAVSGSLLQPIIDVSATGTGLTYQSMTIQDFELGLLLNRNGFAPGKNQLTLNQLSYNKLQLDQLVLNLSQTWLKPEVVLQAQAADHNLSIKTVAAIDESTITGSIVDMSLQGMKTGTWQLRKPVDYLARYPHAVSVERFCLDSENGQLCGEGSMGKQKLSASLRASGLPLSWMAAWYPSRFDLYGFIDIEAQVSRNGDVAEGSVSMNQTPGSGALEIGIDDDPNLVNRITNLTAAINLDYQNLTGTLSANLNQSGSLAGQFSASDPFAKTSPLTGTLALQLPDLVPYAALIPELDISTGQLSGQINLGNTLQQPDFSAETSLTVSGIYLPALAVHVKDLNAEINTPTTGNTRITASAQMGDGQLELTGMLSGGRPDNWYLQAQLGGKEALLMNKPGQRLVATPDLTMNATRQRVDLTGSVTVNEASVEVQPIKGRLSLTSDAVVFNGGQAAGTESPTEINYDIQLIVDQGAHLQLYGLNTNIEGSIRVARQSRGSPLGTGELNLTNGTYTAYGQDLTIEKGVLQFNGSLYRPLVDVRAVRQVSDVTAGIHLTGQVDQLKSELFSTPALADSEILSYIMRGKPLGESSAVDRHAVSSAALSYALKQSTPLTDKIAERASLDEISLSAEEGVETLGITLGKYLTPDLYVRYGINVVDRLTKLYAEYRLSDRWLLETEVGEGQSLDLIYRSNR